MISSETIKAWEKRETERIAKEKEREEKHE